MKPSSCNERPRVALLSNGSEANKGTREIKEAHQHLAARSDLGLNFVGNIEGVDIAHGAADVIVTDGFTGNVVLKMLEGVSETVMNITVPLSTLLPAPNHLFAYCLLATQHVNVAFGPSSMFMLPSGHLFAYCLRAIQHCGDLIALCMEPVRIEPRR